MKDKFSEFTDQFDIGISIRNEILTTALYIEKFCASFLATLLDIKDEKNSRTLGNKSSSLSFNQKLDLLIDIDALSKENKSKLTAFMEIRNQFMHNLDANTYEKCVSFLDGKEKYLNKNYPQSPSLSKESQLEFAIKALSSDVFDLMADLLQKIHDKIGKKVEVEMVETLKDALLQSMEQLKEQFDEYAEEQIAKGPTFNSKKLRGLGTAMSKLFYRQAMLHIKKTYSKNE